MIQQIHPHVRVERDSGVSVARDLFELNTNCGAGAPKPACLWPALSFEKEGIYLLGEMVAHELRLGLA